MSVRFKNVGEEKWNSPEEIFYVETGIIIKETG